MNILLKSISLKNFLSHSSTVLEFKPDDRLILSGRSGAGKSSIPEALVWVLFNTGRVQNRSLIKRGASRMSVAVELLDDSDIYKIVRSLSIPKKNANVVHEISIYKNGQPIAVNGTRNVQDFIEKQIIKCNFPTFVNSVVYLQENLESLNILSGSSVKITSGSDGVLNILFSISDIPPPVGSSISPVDIFLYID